jgi:branched-chain amino acid transport system ATP-binding protein
VAARYGRVEVLRSVSLRVDEGEFVAVLGPNGAGKTTLLRALMRLNEGSGEMVFRNRDLRRLSTYQRAGLGMIMVQEDRGLFRDMSVNDNLTVGAYACRDRIETEKRREQVFAVFPRLLERSGQIAHSLSGGEQQMLAIGRALMAGPKLLMLDEPSLGLAPRMAAEILSKLGELNRTGLSILLVEQKAPLALKLATRAYVLAVGRVVAELTADQFGSHHETLAQYYFA